MNIHKNTFGNTPAAMYLVERVNQLNDKKYLRQLSTIIHSVQSTLADTLRAHEAGVLNIRTVNFVAGNLRLKIENAADNLRRAEPYVGSGGCNMPDELSVDLMCNMLIGDLKSVARSSREVKLEKRRQEQKLTAFLASKPGFMTDELVNAVRDTQKKITINDFVDDKTPAMLIARSLKKLERIGVVSTLY